VRAIQSNRTAESPPKRLAGVMRLGSELTRKPLMFAIAPSLSQAKKIAE
jgi:hypothetical protein